jgi:putative hydrolase of the HAD superfamily
MSVLLLDADGVVFKKGEYFSTHLAQKQHVPEASVTEFFKTEYLPCQSGVSDLKVVIEPYLERWKWSGSVDDLLTYWFTYDSVLNETVVEHITALRREGIKCYLTSNNEQYRAAYLKQVLDREGLLDGYFFSSDGDFKVRKSSPEFFKKVLDRLVVTSDMVSYIDNDQGNLDAARTLGITTYLFRDDIFTILKF